MGNECATDWLACHYMCAILQPDTGQLSYSSSSFDFLFLLLRRDILPTNWIEQLQLQYAIRIPAGTERGRYILYPLYLLTQSVFIKFDLNFKCNEFHIVERTRINCAWIPNDLRFQCVCAGVDVAIVRQYTMGNCNFARTQNAAVIDCWIRVSVSCVMCVRYSHTDTLTCEKEDDDDGRAKSVDVRILFRWTEYVRESISTKLGMCSLFLSLTRKRRVTNLNE